MLSFVKCRFGSSTPSSSLFPCQECQGPKQDPCKPARTSAQSHARVFPARIKTLFRANALILREFHGTLKFEHSSQDMTRSGEDKFARKESPSLPKDMFRSIQRPPSGCVLYRAFVQIGCRLLLKFFHWRFLHC